MNYQTKRMSSGLSVEILVFPVFCAGHRRLQRYAAFCELINSTNPDMVIVAAPTQTHFDIAKFALEKGVNVFVEKPIVFKSQEFNELLAIADKKQLKLIAGHVERYNPVSLKLRQLLEEKKLSKISFSFTRVQPHHWRIEDDIIIDKLIHDLDLSLFLFGGIKGYKILDYKKMAGQVYELNLKTEHRNGTGDIFVSWLKGDKVSRKLKIRADNIFIEGDFLKKILTVNGSFVNCSVPKWIEAKNNQVKDELVDFIVHCFSKSKDAPEPLLNINEIECTVKIIEEISIALNG